MPHQNSIDLAADYNHSFHAYNAAKKTRFAKKEPYDMGKPLEAKEGFTFGCDPEGFIFHKKSGKPVPASDFLPGTKDEPEPVIGGAIQVDGMAAEFNIDPVKTYEDWEHNISAVIAQLETYLPAGYELRFVPSVVFEEDTFAVAPDHCKDLGCQPDFDAWSGGVNPAPNPDNPLMRCAGGHLHTGWTENEDLCNIQHILNCQDLVKQFDFYLGGWSVLHDADVFRRNLYGKMGACRYKPYGVEYRVLSNFWVTTEEFRLEVWNRMNHAVNVMANCYFPEKLSPKQHNWLRDAINKHDMHPELLYLAEYPIQTLDQRSQRI